MQTEQQLQPVDYANAVAAFVADMSRERAAQVYDFVRFLRSQPTYPSPITAESESFSSMSECGITEFPITIAEQTEVIKWIPERPTEKS